MTDASEIESFLGTQSMLVGVLRVFFNDRSRQRTGLCGQGKLDLQLDSGRSQEGASP